VSPSPNRVRQSWSPEAYALARQARSLNFLKIEPLIQKLQHASRSRPDCLVLIHRCAQEQPKRRSWTDEEIHQVCELLIANPVETVASKIGRSTSSVRQLSGRLGIRVRELRCDLFSVSSLAAAMHVRKAEIRYWIEQGWLEAVRKDQGRSTCYNISPEALQRCLREHLAELQKRNIRSPTILAVFNQFCYVPKHTVGEQLLQVPRRSGSRQCTTLQPFPTAEREDAFASTASGTPQAEWVALSGRGGEDSIKSRKRRGLPDGGVHRTVFRPAPRAHGARNQYVRVAHAHSAIHRSTARNRNHMSSRRTMANGRRP
jgi:hypothetical protein